MRDTLNSPSLAAQPIPGELCLCVIVRVTFREKPNLSARRIPFDGFVDFRTDL
jgi:hypothetical protein